jgi:energy-coupling factor transport system ATP-binding protein
VLTVEGVSYRHAGALRPSLRDVDLVLGDGEVVGVVGANDSGKTTLCLVLAGLAPRIVGGTLTGRVSIDGVDAKALRMHEVAALVGIGFDDPAAQLSGVAATVFEEVAFGPANLGVPRAELIERTSRALDALAIAHLSERDPARLSGGQQQLVAIASILALRPRHIVLDEPTAQLDPSGTALVGDALERLAGQGVSILVVEHKTDVLARVADRVVALDAGKVVLGGRAQDVLGNPALVDLGVAPPSDVRLRRALSAAGLDAAVLDRVAP